MAGIESREEEFTMLDRTTLEKSLVLADEAQGPWPWVGWVSSGIISGLNLRWTVFGPRIAPIALRNSFEQAPSFNVASQCGDGLSWASCSYSTHPRSVPGRHWVHVPAQELKAQGITADEAGQHCFRDDVPFFPASFLDYWLVNGHSHPFSFCLTLTPCWMFEQNHWMPRNLSFNGPFFPPHDY